MLTEESEGRAMEWLTEDQVESRYGTAYDAPAPSSVDNEEGAAQRRRHSSGKRPRLEELAPPPAPASLSLLAAVPAKAGAEGGGPIGREDGQRKQPDRFLTDWFLVKRPANEDDSDCDDCGPSVGHDHDPYRQRRYPLPDSCDFGDDHELHGLLEPTPGDDSGNRGDTALGLVPVRITGMSAWILVRNASRRGIWIQSSRARYKLRRPCGRVVPMAVTVRVPSDGLGGRGKPLDEGGREPSSLAGPSEKGAAQATMRWLEEGGNHSRSGDGNLSSVPLQKRLTKVGCDSAVTMAEALLPSQERLHLPLRAKFQLVSNIIDIMSEPEGENENNYVPVHTRRSPANIYALLKPGMATWRRHHSKEEPLSKEPFDLDLLETCPGFVWHHMMRHHPLLHEGCAFMQRLWDMEEELRRKEQLGHPRVVWAEIAYRKSAEEAEQRGMRYPWGDVLPTWSALTVRPNRLIDIEIRNAARGAAKAFAAKRGKKRRRPGRRHKSDYAILHSDTWAAESPGSVAPSFLVVESGGNENASSAASDSPIDGCIRKKDGEIMEENDENINCSDDNDKQKLEKAGGHLARGRAILRKNDRRIVKRVVAAKSFTDPFSCVPSVRDSMVASAAYIRGMGSSQLEMPPPSTLHIIAPARSPYISAEAVTDALRSLGSYLVPHPRDEDLVIKGKWEIPDTSRFAIKEERVVDLMRTIVFNPAVLSMEYMLLTVQCLRRSTTRVLRAWLFGAISGSDILMRGKVATGAQVIFSRWLPFVQAELGRCDLGPAVKETTLAEMIASNIICLIKDSHHVWGRYDLDWTNTLNQTFELALERPFTELRQECYSVKAYLEQQKNENNSGARRECIPRVAQLEGSCHGGSGRENFRRSAFESSWENDLPGQQSHVGSTAASGCPQERTDGRSTLREAEGDSQRHRPRDADNKLLQQDHSRPPGKHSRQVRLDQKAEAVLPILSKPDWMLFPPKNRLCRRFQAENRCEYGPNCSFAHIFRSKKSFSNEVQCESALHFAYTEHRNCPLRSSDFYVNSQKDQTGRVWHTVALLCPIDKTVYCSEGGPHAHISHQGVHWYLHVKDALAAVAGVVLPVLQRKGIISSFGPFLQSFDRYDQSQPTDQGQQSKQGRKKGHCQRHSAGSGEERNFPSLSDDAQDENSALLLQACNISEGSSASVPPSSQVGVHRAAAVGSDDEMSSISTGSSEEKVHGCVRGTNTLCSSAPSQRHPQRLPPPTPFCTSKASSFQLQHSASQQKRQFYEAHTTNDIEVCQPADASTRGAPIPQARYAASSRQVAKVSGSISQQRSGGGDWHCQNGSKHPVGVWLMDQQPRPSVTGRDEKETFQHEAVPAETGEYKLTCSEEPPTSHSDRVSSGQSKRSIPKHTSAQRRSDGSVVPKTMPRKGKNGLYTRPPGRRKKGMNWDAVRGVWIPMDKNLEHEKNKVAAKFQYRGEQEEAKCKKNEVDRKRQGKMQGEKRKNIAREVAQRRAEQRAGDEAGMKGKRDLGEMKKQHLKQWPQSKAKNNVEREREEAARAQDEEGNVWSERGERARGEAPKAARRKAEQGAPREAGELSKHKAEEKAKEQKNSARRKSGVAKQNAEEAAGKTVEKTRQGTERKATMLAQTKSKKVEEEAMMEAESARQEIEKARKKAERESQKTEKKARMEAESTRQETDRTRKPAERRNRNFEEKARMEVKRVGQNGDEKESDEAEKERQNTEEKARNEVIELAQSEGQTARQKAGDAAQSEVGVRVRQNGKEVTSETAKVRAPNEAAERTKHKAEEIAGKEVKAVARKESEGRMEQKSETAAEREAEEMARRKAEQWRKEEEETKEAEETSLREAGMTRQGVEVKCGREAEEGESQEVQEKASGVEVRADKGAEMEERKDVEDICKEAEMKARLVAKETKEKEMEAKERQEVKEAARREAERGRQTPLEISSKADENMAHKDDEERPRTEGMISRKEPERRKSEARIREKTAEAARTVFEYRARKEKARTVAPQGARNEVEAEKERYEVEKEKAKELVEEMSQRETGNTRQEAEGYAHIEADEGAANKETQRRELEEFAPRERQEAEEQVRVKAREKARTEAEAKARRETDEKVNMDEEKKFRTEVDERVEEKVEQQFPSTERESSKVADKNSCPIAKVTGQAAQCRTKESEGERGEEMTRKVIMEVSQRVVERVQQRAKERDRPEAVRATTAMQESAQKEAERDSRKNSDERSAANADASGNHDSEEVVESKENSKNVVVEKARVNEEAAAIVCDEGAAEAVDRRRTINEGGGAVIQRKNEVPREAREMNLETTAERVTVKPARKFSEGSAQGNSAQNREQQTEETDQLMACRTFRMEEGSGAAGSARMEFAERKGREPVTTPLSIVEMHAQSAELQPSILSDCLPRRTTRLNAKSIRAPSSWIPSSCTNLTSKEQCSRTVRYWDTMGTCRLKPSDFRWGLEFGKESLQIESDAFVGYDKRLGRVYFSGFYLKGKQYRVGDYMERTHSGGSEFFRVIAAFQATKSFLGVWSEDHSKEKGKKEPIPRDEIQKRGHPYMLVAPLFLKSRISTVAGESPSRKRKRSVDQNELVLVSDHRFARNHISILPEWLGESHVSYREIQVSVRYENEHGHAEEKVMRGVTTMKPKSKRAKGSRKSKIRSEGEKTKFICQDVLTRDHTIPLKTYEEATRSTKRLGSLQISLLTCPPDVLALTHLPSEWDDHFHAVQVQMMHHERMVKKDGCFRGPDIKFQYTEGSSDDSDCFDEESEITHGK